MSKSNLSRQDSSGPPALWERQAWDTPASFLGFSLYLAQQPPRSVDAAYRAYRKHRGGKEVAPDLRSSGYFRNWSQGRLYNGGPCPGAVPWELRAQAWDDYLAELDRQEEARRWLERRRKLREDEWDLGSKLVERALRMLQFPLTAVESSQDGKTTVVMPAGWRASDIPRTVEVATKLRRLAAEMVTEQVQVDWREEAKRAGIEDPDALLLRVVQELVAEQLGQEAGDDGHDNGDQ